MDPLTISAICISLIVTVSKTAIVVTGFVQDVRGARSDLDAVSRELLSLRTVLELLADDVADPRKFPDSLKKQITGIVTKCEGVVVQIEQTLAKHGGSRLSKAAQWVMSGKEDMAKLRSSLEAHKSALEIALDMVALTLAREIKVDTQEIRNDTSAIEHDTTQILEEIARLQQQLPQDPNRQNTSGFMLERYLDNLTSYAETVCDSFPDETEQDIEHGYEDNDRGDSSGPDRERTRSNYDLNSNEESQVVEKMFGSSNKTTRDTIVRRNTSGKIVEGIRSTNPDLGGIRPHPDDFYAPQPNSPGLHEQVQQSSSSQNPPINPAAQPVAANEDRIPPKGVYEYKYICPRCNTIWLDSKRPPTAHCWICNVVY